MDVRTMYSVKREERQIGTMLTAQKYMNELESKGILSLIAAATDLYNMIAPEHQQIYLDVYPDGFSKMERIKQFENNWSKLNIFYKYDNLRNPEDKPRSIKEFLIKMWWMGYQQLPDYIDYPHLRSGEYLNWNIFVNDLKQLANILDAPHRTFD